MQLLSRIPEIDFMRPRRLVTGFTFALVIASLVLMAVRGLNFGIDFTGGALVEVGYSSPVAIEDVRATLAANGFPNAIVQSLGSSTEVSIRLRLDDIEAEATVTDAVLAVLRMQDPELVLRDGTFVGPQVGEDLAEQGGLALFFALLMIFAYVMLRFRWKFAAGAIAALLHDVVITVGFFSLTGITVDVSVLAAVLAVIGYSLNDTIVVYDRIRENFRAMRRGTAEQIINAAINQTLSRTINTGLTSLLVLLALLFLGGEALYGFSIALIVGIIFGTYSSVYVASAAAIMLNVAPIDLVPPKRETAEDQP